MKRICTAHRDTMADTKRLYDSVNTAIARAASHVPPPLSGREAIWVALTRLGSSWEPQRVYVAAKCALNFSSRDLLWFILGFIAVNSFGVGEGQRFLRGVIVDTCIDCSDIIN